MGSRLYINKQQVAFIIHPKQTNKYPDINKKCREIAKIQNKTIYLLHSYLRVNPFPVRLCSALSALSPPPMPMKLASLHPCNSLTSSPKKTSSGFLFFQAKQSPQKSPSTLCSFLRPKTSPPLVILFKNIT